MANTNTPRINDNVMDAVMSFMLRKVDEINAGRKLPAAVRVELAVRLFDASLAHMSASDLETALGQLTNQDARVVVA